MEMIKYEISFDIMSFMRYYLIRRHLKECYNNKYHLIKSHLMRYYLIRRHLMERH